MAEVYSDMKSLHDWALKYERNSLIGAEGQLVGISETLRSNDKVPSNEDGHKVLVFENDDGFFLFQVVSETEMLLARSTDGNEETMTNAVRVVFDCEDCTKLSEVQVWEDGGCGLDLASDPAMDLLADKLQVVRENKANADHSTGEFSSAYCEIAPFLRAFDSHRQQLALAS